MALVALVAFVALDAADGAGARRRQRRGVAALVLGHDRRRHRLDDAALGDGAQKDVVAGRLAPALDVGGVVRQRGDAADGLRVELGRRRRRDARVPKDALGAAVLVAVAVVAHGRRRLERGEARRVARALARDGLPADDPGDEGGHDEFDVELDCVGQRCELHISAQENEH